MPVCARLLDAAAVAGEIRPDVDAYGLLYGVGNLCAGAGGDSRYDARRMVGLLIAGLWIGVGGARGTQEGNAPTLPPSGLPEG